MTPIETVLQGMASRGDQRALVYNETALTYREFILAIDRWRNILRQNAVGAGTLVGFVGDFCPDTSALIFALMIEKAILVPFTSTSSAELESFLEIAEVEVLFKFSADGRTWTVRTLERNVSNPLTIEFRKREHSGLIVFTSGSTGKPKAILHDCENVMRKFLKPRQGWSTVLFLMMDHFGGFNTFLSCFAYGGTAVCLESRSPEAVCRAISKARATLLPTTPTFLNLLIASGSYRGVDLSSIQLITYGTEVMPEQTLVKIRQIFPQTQFKQTYGLSESGVLRSHSESNSSVWVKIGGDGFEVKVKDNTLWIRSEANMVGYLNAENPFDTEGWLCTGDQVEVRGEFMRIIGRKSEMINVGGQKVFPSEVENVLLQADNIREASVFKAQHPLMGHVVMSRVSLWNEEDPIQLKERLRIFCLERLAKFKVPVRFEIVDVEKQRNERFKKLRTFNQA